MNSNNTQYVTAFYGISGRVGSIFTHFKPFLQSTLKILIFTDVDELHNDISGENIQIVQLHRSELIAFQQKKETTKLPENRDIEKDTLEFLQLMNAKPEFLKRAADLVDARTYVWFDFGILKITKQPDHFIQNLSRAGESAKAYPNKILLPGCKSRDSINLHALFSNVVWRFCGGVVTIPKKLISTFHNECAKQLENCAKSGCITWEVNLWAAIESVNPDLFHWYAADHNDSIVQFPLPSGQKRVIFLTMIKNEHRIIKRCIESALSISDAICVCDTGSTDSTIEVLTEYFKDFTIPTKIYQGDQHAWKNFGHNRSQSFLSAVDFCKELGWELRDTYAIVLDADMELKPQPLFSKELLTANGYNMIQKSHCLEYYNTRFLRLSHPWKCTGVTHEYWDGGEPSKLTMDTIYISDIGDGGCKDDKFERDVRLLEQGLIDSPNNPRYLFYLAQSYKDSGQIDKAIDLYKRRIDAGAWFEEIWFSMYMLMKMYADKKMYPEMEMWGMKAYEFHKARAENIVYLVRHFRDRRDHFKAWHYYQLGSVIKRPDDLLFIETDVYDRQFDYERAIIHDYVFPHKKMESMEHSLKYYNKWHDNCMYMNIEWFVTKIPGTVRNLQFQTIGDYIPTSTSFCKQKDGLYRLNVRYVNYRIQHDGSYLMMDNGVLSRDNPVRTKNYECLMDGSWNILSPLHEMVMKDAPLHNTHIKGLEDVRIFNKDDQLYYTATTLEYSYNGSIRQHTGKYNVSTHTYEQNLSLKPPCAPGQSEPDCEKNWIPYKNDKIIYAWHPFQIGSIDTDNRLVIETRQETPKFLSHMRGSSTLVEQDGFLWGLTHCVIYKQPRKYYHMVVKIDPKTDRLVGYTYPFFFLNNAIEYCLGFEKQGDSYTTIVSQNDSNPVMVTFKDSDMRWQSI